ncbi:MAG: exodeoxyribonuclease V subunit gamma, partial [Propionibacteriaceae bacterium]|nr:exodeoxyribonuclease V subunit gamma [Propionibacteriaceae bacterium]
MSAKTTSSPRPGGVVPCQTWELMLAQITSFFAAPADPFVQDTLIVPSFGHGRHIAQHLSKHLNPQLATSGICAGINALTTGQFVKTLLGEVDDDPWAGASLVLAIADLLNTKPEGAPLPGFRSANQVARLFENYLRRCPSMLLGWDAGDDAGPDGARLPSTQTWQPVLWRALVQRLEPQPHPAAARLRAAELVSKVPGRVA